MDYDFETIKFELHDDGIGILSLNRPDNLNAMSLQLIEDLHEILDHLMINIDCRVLILRAEGRVFCAGLDLKEMPIIAKKKIPEEYKKLIIEDLEQIKLKNLGKDQALQVLTKEELKELLGRSTDCGDALMMRMFFELRNECGFVVIRY